LKPSLAFDTSTDIGTIALGDADAVIESSTLSVRSAHSERMLPAILDLLRRAGAALSDLEAIVVGSGPGSFTGLRIGAAMAKGLCFAGHLPLYAYSSLSATVAGLSIVGPACALIDARGERVFAATFGSTFPFHELSPPRLLELRDLIADLEPLDRWTFGGDGAIKHADLLREHGGRLLPAEVSHPRAEALLWLKRERPEGEVEDVLGWEPAYLLPSAAERATAP
jgi:tRNA threonylcarbamoyl adenosine modification protein YeaZ